MEVGREDCLWCISHPGGQTLRTHRLRLVTGVGSSLLRWALGRVGAVCRAGGAEGLGGAGHTPSLCASFPLWGGVALPWGGAFPDPATPCWTQGSRISVALCGLAPVAVMLRNEPNSAAYCRQREPLAYQPALGQGLAAPS